MAAMTTEFEHVELFGSPALFTNGRIDRSSIPKGWYCYDLRGSDYDPGIPETLEAHVGVNHAGTLLSPAPFVFPTGQDYIDIKDEMDFLGEDLTLYEFCDRYGMGYPQSIEMKFGGMS